MTTSIDAIDLSNRVGLVTGATSGIGRATAEALAGMGAELYLACRNRAKEERVAAEIEARTGNDRPRLLVNNAAVMNFKRRTTVDGYEEMFAVNHLAHFVLTNLLLDRIKASSQARIVNVASGINAFVKGLPFDDLSYEQGFRTMTVYGHTKLANILFTWELAKRLKGTGVAVYAVHPGAVATRLGAQNGWRGKLVSSLLKPFLKSPEKGARTSIYVCVSPELQGVSGRYFESCRERKVKPWATDAAAARRLWGVSASMTNLPAS